MRQRIADQLEALAVEVVQLRRRTGDRRTVEWSPELDARVLALLAGGLSYRVVARRVSAETGQTISKDAVVGRAHRLGAPPRPSPIRAAEPGKRQSGHDRPTDQPAARTPRAAEFTVLAAEGTPGGAPSFVHGVSCHADVL